MLNIIYYPVSGIMWLWHWLFDKITPDTPNGNGIAWALSVVFLVFTLRAVLYKPFVKQIQTTKKMQEIQPQMQAIRKKYGKDQVKMAEEMQKLQREHGFNPLLGCLPMFMQIPVFIGLFHVLRSFNRTGAQFGMRGHTMSVEENANTANYFFSSDHVQNFLEARLFGVPLASWVTMPSSPSPQWEAFMSHGAPTFTRIGIVVVVVPIMLIASLMTYLNARAAVQRQSAAALESQQTRIMNMLSQYVFPLGILVSGPFFPVAILLYWVSNNIWTYGQQHLVFGRMAREEEAAKVAKEEKNKANAPKPGARPDRTKRDDLKSDGTVADGSVAEAKPDDAGVDSEAESSKGESLAKDSTSTKGAASPPARSGPAKGKAAGSKKNRQAARKNKRR
ncbi:MAG TPA: membrane protein insertase YidC [Gordonia sp. (in: high G+C Gram-positive bacteria)]|uniref:membrane protein insertase YidC n=1 Tax=unclassified Gordonia (in: high G+C Gram-positive bacteria) TaxID=2657482 RepID=UPI000FB0C8B1|nr:MULTISPECIES: membrane protein insertase YidC [unclassified Gordonia (in: high G+C Gram-positive bacteria)]RUP38949.1 MAG: membrane protein insertase YidC [Gordonia sp. (in: high G+C Gram-positive bacteria)]HNP56440.1 membrane protein insertase YidC [Gordonia sp. (in: high G+C Gram-positive bacteria)]HRC50807.1 membrane protein insertase YidC [Gordonia sp. (in: high G+C Gram-positive bacteria)]